MSEGDEIDICRFCGGKRGNLGVHYKDFPGFIICEDCVRKYRQVRVKYYALERARKRSESDQSPKASAACSFCGKQRTEVGVLIAGPVDVNVCDECVELLADIIAEHRSKKDAE